VNERNSTPGRCAGVVATACTPETKAATEQARLLLEQADALGETPSDPLQLFEVLYGAFVANVMAFNADVSRNIAAHVLELAEKQSARFHECLDIITWAVP